MKLDKVREWLTPLLEENVEPIEIYTGAEPAADTEKIFSLLFRVQEVAATEKDLKDVRATLRSTEDEHRRNLEGLNERLKNVKARHTLLCETLRALSGSPASEQKFAECLESGTIGTRDNIERLHLLLSNSSEARLPKTHSARECRDTSCTAAFLHKFQPPTGGDIHAAPGSAVNCNISDELSLLEEVKMFWVFKKGLDDKLSSTFAWRGPEAADSNPVATQWPPDDLLSAVEILGALKIDCILSVLQQFIDEGEGREEKKNIHSTKAEKAIRRMAELAGLDSKEISVRLDRKKPGDGNQFLSQKREQDSTSDEDIENDVAKSIKTTALRRCERLIERIAVIQSRSEEQETRQKHDLEKLWAICQEWLGLGDQWPDSYGKNTSGHSAKLTLGDQFAFIINAIEDAAQNFQNIERTYDNQYEEFKAKAEPDVELSKILNMTTWPSDVDGFPERILHKSSALQQIKDLRLEISRAQFIFALKDFNAAKTDSQTTECILESAKSGGLYYEGLTGYLGTASLHSDAARVKRSEGSDAAGLKKTRSKHLGFQIAPER
ncbi:transposase [Metarhizium robertsii ARSEF 23]|uniref:Transposase n=1 Tax=Metarhizium robertsii (strain ARSEF 23 / ATCC MYA-3075) TaxID=655844 RepID=A0A0B2XCY3_METRA|nr:transposase [Metarhizium robertsii ARSEF 23]KHO10585.1 transposase [Metarhizium robertsii ARSEF 23]